MSISSADIQKALRIKKAINEYFDNSIVTKVQAKELMNLFVEKGIFPSNHRDGLPIRDFLRHLDENNHLRLIPQVFADRKEINTNWFFIKSNI